MCARRLAGVGHKVHLEWGPVHSCTVKKFLHSIKLSTVLLYSCETSKLTKTIIHQLQVLINRCIRRIMKIFWPVQISNQELWARAKQKPIQLEIRQRKWGWLGHTLRQPPGDIAKAALDWNPQGTRSRGRPQTTWRRTIFEEIRHQGKTWNKVKVLASNRVRW